MSVGYPINKAVLDARAGLLVIQLRNSFQDVERYWQWLNDPGHTDSDLIEKFGYTQEDCDTLRAGIAALAKLSRVARGQATVPTADNFWFHAQKLTGLE